MRVTGTKQQLWDRLKATENEVQLTQNDFISQKYVIDELRQENERLREALEDIAFGRVEGDYSDARQYAREALEEEQK